MSDERSEAFEAVYEELRVIAHRMLFSQGKGKTLQPTMLVHEAYLKLSGASVVEWKDRTHFLRLVARAMRQVLVNYARDRAAAKRGGGEAAVTITTKIGAAESSEDRVLDVLSLDKALSEIASKDSRMAEVIELRIFAGMTANETAETLGVSKRTVDNDLKVGKLLLADALYGGGGA